MLNQNLNITIRAFDKTSKAFNSAAKGIKAVAGSIFSLKTGLVAVAGVAGMGLLVKRSLDATDSLAKTARKIGVTTEALGQMRYAAELTGVSTSTMDMALQRFTRRAAEAAIGTGEAKGALKELGLSAGDLIKMPLDKQMIQLSKAFQDVETDADKVRLAMKLFDSEGVSLVNTLGLGEEALSEMFDEATAFGVAMSRNAASGVEEANDSITRLKTLMGGLTDQIVAALSPAITNLVTTLTTQLKRTIDENYGSVENFAKVIAEKLLTTLNELKTIVIDVSGKIADMFNKYKQFKGRKAFDEYKKQVNALNDRIVTLVQIQKRAGEGFGMFGGFKIMDRIKLSTMGVTATTEGLRAEIERLQQSYNNLLGQAQNYAVAASGTRLPSAVNSKDDEKELNKSQNKFKEYFSALKDQGKAEANWQGKMAHEKTNFVLGHLSSSMAGLAQHNKKAFKLQKHASIATAIINTFTGATKMLGATPFYPLNVALAAATIAAGTAQVAAIKAQSFDGGGFTGNGARAGGLDGKGGFPAILHPNETVVDHTKGGGNPVVVNQTINVTTGVQNTVKAEIQNMMPRIVDEAKAAVAVANQRGGAFARMMS